MTAPTTPEDRRGPHQGLVALLAVVVVLAIAFGLAGLVVGGDGDGGGEGAATGGGGPTETVAVELGDLFVEPDRVDVPTGSRLVVEVTNGGDQQHDLKLEGEEGTDRLDPGDQESADFGIIDGDAEAWCTVPGHKEAGMLLTITAVEAPTTTPPTTTSPTTTQPAEGS